MRNQKVRRIALTGMLFALAVVLSFFESLLTPFLGLPPGVKLGLANIVVMYALLFLSRGEALLLVVLKAAFALLTRGGMAGLLSLAGGLFSLAVIVLLLLPKHQPSVLVVSVAGAVAHNIAQLLVVWLLLGGFSLYYLPVLLVSGVVMGCVTALMLRVLLPALEKTGITQKQGNSPDREED